MEKSSLFQRIKWVLIATLMLGVGWLGPMSDLSFASSVNQGTVVVTLTTISPTKESTITPTPTNHSTGEPTVTPTSTGSSTGEPTVTSTPTSISTGDPTVTPTPTAYSTGDPTVTSTPTAYSTGDPTITPTPTAYSTGDPTVTPTPTAYSTGDPTITPTPTIISTGDPTVTVTPTATGDPTITPTSTAEPPPDTLFGIILLQGRTDHSGTDILLIKDSCPDRIVSAANIPDILTTVTDEQGYFELKITEPYGCLQAVQHGYLVGQKELPQGDLGTTTLLGGDVTEDNQIDIFDLAFIGSFYDTSNSTVDVNGDGQVDIFDLALAAANYQQTGPIIID